MPPSPSGVIIIRDGVQYQLFTFSHILLSDLRKSQVKKSTGNTKIFAT